MGRKGLNDRWWKLYDWMAFHDSQIPHQSLSYYGIKAFPWYFLNYIMWYVNTIITWINSLPIWTTDRLTPGIAEQSDVSQTHGHMSPPQHIVNQEE